VPGAKEIAVEFNSLSKSYSMAGNRIGMAVGNAEIVNVLGRIKTNIDSGVYGAVQDTATAALTGDQSWMPERNEIYRRRRDKLCDALCRAGITVNKPQAGLYLWARVPEGYRSAAFAELMLQQLGIAVTSGTSYGQQGEGYFRMSLTVPDHEVDAAVKRLEGFQLEM
jgi:LL-diaminopimelate aminotransferase